MIRSPRHSIFHLSPASVSHCPRLLFHPSFIVCPLFVQYVSRLFDGEFLSNLCKYAKGNSHQSTFDSASITVGPQRVQADKQQRIERETFFIRTPNRVKKQLHPRRFVTFNSPTSPDPILHSPLVFCPF